ncbi:hypothetical protein HCA58_06065 [Micromonospora sp. HNM0581]|uniref:hypothetical protein n=1 Tax=Micromonospora sp. HNM0581 TaxID=2716341 RepID=UPI00146D8BF5|nr:hypothetical protein [Micromonospora sp. HNM0581]NLU77967.1 hypothetical protein [Micromonospora sp. HNM0581]
MLPIIPPDDETAGHRWLLVRRRIRDGELAFLPLLGAEAGTAAGFGTCRGHQVGDRGNLPVVEGHRWSRPTPGPPMGLLVPLHHPGMLAHAILTVIAARERATPSDEPDLIPLTVAEVRRLFAKLIANPVPTINDYLAWSMATTPPVPSQDQPLPPSTPTTPSTPVYITIPGWSTSRSHRPAQS